MVFFLANFGDFFCLQIFVVVFLIVFFFKFVGGVSADFCVGPKGFLLLKINVFINFFFTNVTLPPEMSRIATRSLLGYSHFPKGGAMLLILFTVGFT